MMKYFAILLTVYMLACGDNLDGGPDADVLTPDGGNHDAFGDATDAAACLDTEVVIDALGFDPCSETLTRPEMKAWLAWIGCENTVLLCCPSGDSLVEGSCD